MKFCGSELTAIPINSGISLFEEDDAQYISMGLNGYAICWLDKPVTKSEPDKIYLKLLDVKGWPRGDVILVATSSIQNNNPYFPEHSILNFPVMKLFEESCLIIAWVDDMDEIYIQMLDLKGNLIGEKVKSKILHPLNYDRRTVEEILELHFYECAGNVRYA